MFAKENMPNVYLTPTQYEEYASCKMYLNLFWKKVIKGITSIQMHAYCCVFWIKEFLACTFYITSWDSYSAPGFYMPLLIFAMDFSFVLDEWLCVKDGIYYIL